MQLMPWESGTVEDDIGGKGERGRGGESGLSRNSPASSRVDYNNFYDGSVDIKPFKHTNMVSAVS